MTIAPVPPVSASYRWAIELQWSPPLETRPILVCTRAPSRLPITHSSEARNFIDKISEVDSRPGIPVNEPFSLKDFIGSSSYQPINIVVSCFLLASCSFPGTTMSPLSCPCPVQERTVDTDRLRPDIVEQRRQRTLDEEKQNARVGSG